MTERREARIRSLAVAVSVLTGLGLLVAPAPAFPAQVPVVGHRCFTNKAEPNATIENTLASVAYVDAVPRAWCEADVWRLADGSHAMWHDRRLQRVASSASLNALRLPGSTMVNSLTADQFRQIDTKGGEPAADLDSFLRELGARNVKAIIEVKNGLGPPAVVESVLARAETYGARVIWYAYPSSTCGLTPGIQAIKDAGGSVGLKMTSTCTEQLAPRAVARLVGTITQNSRVLAANKGLLATRYDNRGVVVLASRASPRLWPRLAGYGVNRNVVKDVLKWKAE